MKTSYSLISAVIILLFIYSIFQFGIGKRIATNKIYGAPVIDLTKTPPSVAPIMTTDQMKSPQTIYTTNISQPTDSTTKAQVIETFTAGKITVDVDLTKESDQWKVDDIDCIKQ